MMEVFLKKKETIKPEVSCFKNYIVTLLHQITINHCKYANRMIWTLLFVISIAQGLFLISLIALKGSKNPIATRLIITMVMIMVFTNFATSLIFIVGTSAKIYTIGKDI